MVLLWKSYRSDLGCSSSRPPQQDMEDPMQEMQLDEGPDPHWWCYPTAYIAGVSETSDMSAGSLTWRQSSSLDDPYAQCWPHWRTHNLLTSSSRLCTGSPVAAARPTSEVVRRLKTRVKECQDDCYTAGDPREVSECRACMGEPSPHWVGRDLSYQRGQKTQETIAEGGHPQQDDPVEERFHRDAGLELLNCWMSTLWPKEKRTSVHFYLKKTRTSSWSIAQVSLFQAGIHRTFLTDLSFTKIVQICMVLYWSLTGNRPFV